MALFRPIRVRLTLWFVLLLAITLAIFCAALYLALRHNLNSTLNDSLESRAQIVAGLVVDVDRVDVAELTIPGDPVEGEEFVRVFDSSGNLVFDNSGEKFRPPDDPTAVSAALSGAKTRRDLDLGPELRALTAPIRANGKVIGAVEVGLSTDALHSTLRTLLVIIAVIYPLALIIASGGGVFLAGRALSPIDGLTRTARRISAEDLSQRLDLRLPDDEVGRLARTFDEMIARLDDAFRRQRQFTADASHELRTPLTAIKGQTEVALQRDRDPAEYRSVLRSVNVEVDRMIRLVSSLLTLARADAQQVPLTKESISLGALVSDAADQVRPAASNKGVSVRLRNGAGTQVTADQDLLLQLMLNLLDNAVKHTPLGGSIVISWSNQEGHAKVVVADEGPGIPSEHLPHIFDRFYRVDRARSRDGGGVGLGLSICRWIAEAHGGSIHADSSPGGGATFTVDLPMH
jgi:heavy metal sensor kinase